MQAGRGRSPPVRSNGTLLDAQMRSVTQPQAKYLAAKEKKERKSLTVYM